jgi:site-specific DNA-methyltransferase (adenine-specific)
LDAAAAIKQKGKNIDAARVEKAKELNAQPATLVNVELENNIHAGDAVETMKRIDDGVASLILFSPHYHGVNIEYDPPLPPQSYSEYLDYQQELLVESLRVSRRGGRLAIVLDTVRNHEDQRNYMLPVVADMTHLAIQCGWSFFNDIAWLKDEISGSKTNFGSLASCSAPIINRNHETILLFFRDTNKLDGDIALCDLSREEHLAWWTSAWHIKPELNRAIRDAHKAPFPEEIPHRLIKLLTYGKDLVIDPYNGSGTTTAVAARLGRRYIGVDRSQNYCAFARQRITSRHIIETVAIDVPLESSIADLCTFTSHGS